MRLMLSLTLLATSALLTACAGIFSRPAECARLPGGGQYCLSREAGPEYAAEQETVLRQGDKSMRLFSRIESGSGGLHFAGITPLGQTLFQVSWVHGELRASLPPSYAQRIDAALFPALIQLASWPADQVRRGLSAGLELREEPGQRRVVQSSSTGEASVLTIRWHGDHLPYETLRFDAPEMGLSIDARHLDGTSGPDTP